MNDPNSPSLSEPPPPAAAQSHPAQQLHQHPVWQASAGRANMAHPRGRGAAGRGRGRAAQAPPEDDSTSTRYERISLLAQELQGCATGGDGADSAAFSEDEYEDVPEATREYDAGHDGEDDGGAVSALESSSDEEEGQARPSKRRRTATKRKSTVSNEEMFSATAFGARTNNTADAMSDNESLVSRTSSRRMGDAQKNAFPVRGVTCVGCALANRIEPVERFVRTNVGRQAENALWKFASLTWQREVVEPARREGVHVVEWRWRDIANHFRMHTTMAVVGRTAMVNTLTAMRCQVEATLVRNDNGERSLDKANAELALKVRNDALLHRSPPAQRPSLRIISTSSEP
jgi:hypothetical protein